MKNTLSSRSFIVLTTATILAVSAQPLYAQSNGTSAPGDARSFGGPEGVSSQIDIAYEDKDSTFEPGGLERGMQSYYDWKQRLKEDHGFTIGFNAYWLYQNASDTLGSEDDAWGQIYRLQGNWTLLGRGTGHPGRIEYRIEHRSNIGSNLSPSELGGQVGAAALNSGFAYSANFDTDLAVFNWTQLFNNQTIGVAAGRMAFDVYLDAMAFQTFSKGFINRAFVRPFPKVLSTERLFSTQPSGQRESARWAP
jgi:hypothetical protein